MIDRRVKGFIVLISLLAVVEIFRIDWGRLAELPASSWAGLGALVLIGVLAEGLAIRLTAGAQASTSSIAFLPLLAGVQLFGPEAGILLIAVTQTLGEFGVRKKGAWKGVFNIAQMLVATGVAGWAFTLLGGIPMEGRGPAPGLSTQVFPFISFGLLVIVVNHSAVSMAIALNQGLPFRKVWESIWDDSGASLNDILISPIALSVALLYVQFGVAGLLVIVLPMLFIRYSYLTTSRLRDSNEDPLTALVKAIETRDPYTSGHSQRVSKLARRIADAMGISRLVAEHVETAALLHDIGKIEATYTDILSKPGSLSPEERAIIESHVMKGEQLLRDLSSVPEEVVKCVRHHHEREDGQGYPDGLFGDEIPLGAKIIVVCDAVDAMLSDRPYRRALPLTVVLGQLQEHAGRQFDHRIVNTLMKTDILTEYADMMLEIRGQYQRAQSTVEREPLVHSPQPVAPRPAYN